MTFATWSQTAASNTSVGGISTDGTVTLVKQIDNMFRGMMAELAVARDDGTIVATAERGYLHGLTLSNNSGDATNDIDIAVGECATVDSPYWKMALASSITKRLDAAWAVGTGNGGLDTGAIANTTYHVWLIQRSDTLVVDALFSTSATAPTMPANYDRKRRIGSILRAAGAIVVFWQHGDVFRCPIRTDRNSTAAAVSALLTLSVPTGIVVAPIMQYVLNSGPSVLCTVDMGSAEGGSANIEVCGSNTQAGSSDITRIVIPPIFYTDTSARIYFSQANGIGTPTTSTLNTYGWIDTRGRT